MTTVAHPPSQGYGLPSAYPLSRARCGLSPDSATWLTPRYADWLVPVHALSALFRGKFQAALATTGLLPYVPPQVWHKGWMTHCHAAGTGTEVLASCAPYLYRGAMTKNRLETCEDGHVTFRVKERTSPEWTHRTRPVEACIRRFLQHVLPKGFTKVRYYGVLSPSCRPALAQRRTLLAASPRQAQAPHGSHHRDRREPSPAPEAALHCRACGGQLVFLSRLVPQQRRPPSCAREVPCLTDVRPVVEGARAGVHGSPGTASQDGCCLRTPPPALPAALTESPRPMPRSQTGSIRVWGLLLPHGHVHMRRFSLPPQPLPHRETPHALRLSSGLFNPALCGGVTPHECLIR